jgi:hypothetical protein
MYADYKAVCKQNASRHFIYGNNRHNIFIGLFKCSDISKPTITCSCLGYN